MAEWWAYCRFCRQRYLAGGADKCDLCGRAGGLIDPASPEALEDAASKRAQAGDVTDGLSGTEEVTILDAWRLIKLTALGFVFVGAGLWLTLAPGARADPEAPITWRIIAMGAGVVALGVMFLSAAAATVWGWVKRM